MSEYYLDYTGEQLDDAINKVRNGYVFPTEVINIDSNVSNMDITNGKTLNVNVKIPANYIDTSGATADSYDIYYGETAYVNGQKVTGAYRSTGQGGEQWSASSDGCSASQLRIPCPFKPQHVTITYNHSAYDNNTVICAWFRDNAAAIYHSKTSSGIIRTNPSNYSSYFYYDETNKEIVINRPSSSYSWSTNNYKIFAFR